MNFSINKETNAQEATFNAKLVSISDKILTNSNGKNYKLATIEFEKVNGEPGRCSAFVFEGNYKYGMKIGETYLATATQTEQSVLVRVSHLVAGGIRPDAEMFGFETTATQISAKVEPLVDTEATF